MGTCAAVALYRVRGARTMRWLSATSPTLMGSNSLLEDMVIIGRAGKG